MNWRDINFIFKWHQALPITPRIKQMDYEPDTFYYEVEGIELDSLLKSYVELIQLAQKAGLIYG